MRLFMSLLRRFLAWGANWRLKVLEKMRPNQAPASTTETEEHMWERASAEAGYVTLPDYIERHGGEGRG